jgi:hypothetical protein
MEKYGDELELGGGKYRKAYECPGRRKTMIYRGHFSPGWCVQMGLKVHL